MSAVFPPGPKGGRLLGCLIEIRRDPLAFLDRVSAEFGDIAHFRLANFHVFLLNHPDDIEQILVTHPDRFVKGHSLSGARRVFGNGLLTSDGRLHQRQRRLMQPAFHRLRMPHYADVITRLTVEQCRRWSDGHVIDVAEEMGHLTLKIAERALFGTDADALAGDIGSVLSAVANLLEVPILPFAPVMDLLPLPHVRRLRRARADLDNVLGALVERRRRNRSDNGDLLTLLLKSGDERESGTMSDAQLRDEMVTFLLAGHDTTANALAWTWYLLALHPDNDARLHEEIEVVLGGRTPSAEDVPLLPFARAVFAESMRLYPPAWLLGRVAVEPHEAQGYVVPSGSLVVVSPWVVHRNSTYFPEPGQFRPDRWLSDGPHPRPRYAYFPFGGGSRGCLGEAFAWMEGVLLISTIAQHWRFRLLEDMAPPTPQPALTLKPKSGLLLRIEQRS